jgi:hypothetical protein
MNELNRTSPTNGWTELVTQRNEFCVCRVIEDCALVKIESLAKLRTARQYMRRVASRVPGSYVVFSYRTRRVLGKVVSRSLN